MLFIDNINRKLFLETVLKVNPIAVVFDYNFLEFRENICQLSSTFILAKYDVSKFIKRYKYLWLATSKKYQKSLDQHGSVEAAKEHVLNILYSEVRAYLDFCCLHSDIINVVELPVFGFDENYEDLLTSHADYQNLTFMCTVKDLSVIPNLVGSYNWIGIHKSIQIEEVKYFVKQNSTLLKSFDTQLHAWNRYSKKDFVESCFDTYSTCAWTSGALRGNTYEYVGNLKMTSYHATKGRGKGVRSKLKSKCLRYNIDHDLLLADDVDTVNAWNLTQFDLLSKDLSLRSQLDKEARRGLVVVPEQKVITTQVEAKNNENSLADYDPTKTYSRTCNTCFLSAQCPVYEVDSSCRVNTRPVLKTSDDFKDLLHKVIEIQGERVIFSAFAEKTANMGINQEVSNEIEKLTRIMKDAKEIMSQNDEVTIKARGAGVISKIFGSYGKSGGGSKPSQSEKIIDVSPMEDDDE